MQIETSYNLKLSDGESSTLHSSALGWLNNNGKIITTKEAIEPWSFDPAVAEAMANHQVSLDHNEVEILATLLSPNNNVRSASFQRGELKIIKTRADQQKALSLSSGHTYSVAARATKDNIAFLEVSSWQRNGGDVPVASNSSSVEWAPAAVYFVRKEEGGEFKPHLLLTEVRLQDGRYIVKDPFDPPAFGSPVWIKGGIAGILQTEDSASDIQSLVDGPK